MTETAPTAAPAITADKPDARDERTPGKQPSTRSSQGRPGNGIGTGLAVLSLLLSLGACGAAGYLWWQQQQAQVAQKTRESDVEASLFSTASQIAQASKMIEQQTTAHRQLQSQVAELSSQRDDLQQKVALVDQRIVEMLQGTARIDWMLAEVGHLVTVAERRLSLLGDVRGALSLLEAAEPVVKAMDEPMARALRQALIDDIQNLGNAESEVIDTEGLLLRINSTKKQVQALQPPRPTFRSEPVVLPETAEPELSGFPLFWYKVETFVASLVRFQKNKEPLASVAVDPQARFYLQQSILLLLDQAQLAVLRGEPSTYTLSLQETIDRVQRYLRVDTQDGERVLRELQALAQQPVKQTVPTIRGSLLALDAFRQAWEKGRGAREAAAARLQQAANLVDAPASAATSGGAAASQVASELSRLSTSTGGPGTGSDSSSKSEVGSGTGVNTDTTGSDSAATTGTTSGANAGGKLP